MRITGGAWRSRRLHGPGRSTKVRPTPDAMRERAFAVLGERVVGANILDLFAGTGSVGLEAMSRGAAAVIFVERHPPTAKILRINCALFELDLDRAGVMVQSVRAALAELSRREARFDLLWADPPFEKWREGLEAVVTAFRDGLLGDGAVSCLECPAKAPVEAELPDELQVARDLRGGASRVVMITRRSG